MPQDHLEVIVLNDYAHVTGGAGQVALSTASALARRGKRVTLFSAVNPVAPEVTQSGVRVIVTGQHDIKSDPIRIRAATQGLWNFRAARLFREVLSRCDPENTVIHVHGWCKALTSSVLHLALKTKFSVVITLHDYFYACPTGGFFNFPKSEICRLKPLSIECLKQNCDRDGYGEKLWRSLRQEIQRFAGLGKAGVRYFITISNFSEEILRPLLPDDAKLYRISNPIDAVRSEPVDVRLNKQFVSVGRLSVEKGFGLFATAAKRLGCEATFVGEGPFRDEIIRIYPQATVTGWQSRQGVFDRLRHARALILASVWYEAQPLVVLEGAALGIPAIVSDSCAGRDMVEHNVTGLWFRSGDALDLQEKLSTLSNPQIASRMGRAAYDRYWSNPSTMERHLDSLECCYRDMLAARFPATATASPVSQVEAVQ